MRPIQSIRFRMRRRVEHRDPRQLAQRVGAQIGKGVQLPAGTRVTATTSIQAHTWFSGRPTFAGEGAIDIGRWCAIGEELRAISSNHDMTRPSMHLGLADQLGLQRRVVVGTVSVGNGVWIGDRVTLLPGACIGDGAVIAAGAVVRSQVPAYHLAGGVPAVPIRSRFAPDVITVLRDIRWWDWDDAEMEDKRAFFDLDLLGCSVADILRAST